jgi:hypothetical protein
MVYISLYLIASNYYTNFQVNNITLYDIYKYLITNYDFTLVELKKCIFISDDDIMKREDIYCNDQIMISCTNYDIRCKFMEFMIESEINSESSSDNSDCQSEEIEINEQPVDYLLDPNFKILLKIIKNNPQYLQLACTFISHGDIVHEIDDYVWNSEYNYIYEKIKNEYKDDDNLKNIICHYNGNENLIRRYMLMI